MNSKPDLLAHHLADKEEAIVDLVCTRLGDITSILDNNDNRSDAGSCDLIVVARSAASPVMTALVRLNDELTERGISVRAIVTHRGPGDGLSAWLDESSELSFARSVGLLVDKRFHEAHEQLAFGDLSCWTGDSTRRPPGKSDAYHRLSVDCARTVAWARSGFERLWTAGEPLASIKAATDDDSHTVEIEPATACTLPSLREDSRPLAATRH